MYILVQISYDILRIVIFINFIFIDVNITFDILNNNNCKFDF